MQSAPHPTEQIAALKDEMEAIHSANAQYRKQGAANSRQARAEDQRRLDRLDEIREELARLCPG